MVEEFWHEYHLTGGVGYSVGSQHKTWRQREDDSALG